MENEIYTIISRDSQHKGTAYIDEDLRCEVEDCNSDQYVVSWDDGLITTVCGFGLTWLDDNTAQITN